MSKLALALLLACAVCPAVCRAEHKAPVLQNQNEVKPDVSQCHYGPGEYHWTPSIGLDVTKEGLPDALEIIHSTGDNCIDQAAAAAVKQYRFAPATTGKGKPVKFHLLITVDINIVIPEKK